MKMKLLAACALASAALSISMPAAAEKVPDAPHKGVAEHNKHEAMPFEAHKAKMLERLDKRIERQTAFKACLEAANSHKEAQKCFPAREGGDHRKPHEEHKRHLGDRR